MGYKIWSQSDESATFDSGKPFFIPSVKPAVIKYSIIIVSYNCKESLKGCLHSLLNNSVSGTEIIVFDNNSTDNTRELEHDFAEVEFVFSEVNEGFAKGCNLGSAKSSGEYLIFLNPDTLVTPGWLGQLEMHFQHPGTGAVGPLSNYVAGLQKYEAYTDERLQSMEEINNLAAKIHNSNKGRGISTRLLIGFCLMIKKQLFIEMGKMDEDLFLGNDDLDLSWRLNSLNYKLIVASDTFIYHEGQKSFQTEPDEKVTRLVEDSTNALYKKLVNHYGSEDLVPAPEEMWGIGWFNPTIKGTLESIRGNKEPEQFSGMNFTWIIYTGPGDKFSILEETIQSIPIECHPDVIVVNQSGNTNMPFEGYTGTKLDFNAKIPAVRALKKSLALAEHDKFILCQTGILFTGLFTQSLKQPVNFQNKLIKISVKSSLEQAEDFIAFLGSKPGLESLLAENIDQTSLIEVLNNNMVIAGEFPAIQAKSTGAGRGLPGSLSQYPEPLAKYMKNHDKVGFSGKDSDKVFALDGSETELATRDLIIHRLESAAKENVELALKNIRETASSMDQLILLWLNPSEDDKNRDLNNIRDAIWNRGFYLDAIEQFTETDHTGKNPQDHVSNGYQFVCKKRSSDHSLDKLVSIIILGYNQIEYTKNCIESILANTRQNYELILIDNGSNDGTSKYFNSVKDAIVIINKENLGVARGWNQGLKKASGDYLLIFNNDTIVPPDSLENLVRLAECSPATGLVGPRSNNISGPQLIENINIKTLPDIMEFSKKWQQDHDLSAIEFERITGFCMLIPRAVFSEIGYFDERYGKGNFEDDDYCFRARYSGYKLLIANDSFIFHFGSVSFSGESVDWQGLMKENQKKFQEKWKKGKAALKDTHIETDQDSKIQVILDKATQAYTSGNFDEAQKLYLEAADIDEHSEIYNGLGILEFHRDHFSESLQFFKRALELNPLDNDISKNILELIDKCCSAEIGLECLNALLVQFPDNKIFLESIDSKVSLAPEPTGHWKEQVEEFIASKRYTEAIDLLEGTLKSGNDLSFCYNYLGIISFECNDHEMAWQHFDKSIQMNLFYEDALVNYCDAGIMLNKKSDVLGTLEKVFSYPEKSNEFNEIKQIYHQLKLESSYGSWNAEKIIASRENNIQGENLIREGLMERARNTFEEIIKQDPQNFRAHNNMGLVYWYSNDFKSARIWFDKSLELNPTYVDALVNLFDVSLKTTTIDEFRPRLDKILQLEPQCREATEILNLILDKKSAIYEINNYESMDSVNKTVEEGDALLKAGKMNDATIKYIDSIETNPENYMAYNGLGIIAYKRKMYEDAHRLFDTALQLNPLDKDSLLNLWENSKFISRQEAAIQRLVSALEIDPTLSEIKTIVDSYTRR